MPRLLVNVFSVLSLLALAACVDLNEPEGPGYILSTSPPATPAAAAPKLKSEIPSLSPQLIPADAITVRVGLLLPMAGESQALGQSMLDAATLAMHDVYMPLAVPQIHARLVLIPEDTGGTPSSSAAATQATLQQGVKLLVGPLYSASVSGSAPLSRKAGVPMLSLSNNRAVAGDDVYTMGFLPEQQIKRVAEYALRANVTSLAALLPNDTYGDTVSNALKAVFTAHGISVTPIEMYGNATSNLDAAVARLKQAYDKNRFQALFIADGGEQLKQVLAALKAQGLDNTNLQLIGTGLWDDEAVRQLPGLQGAWFASSPPRYYAEFERHFMAAYGYKPERLASLAYDAVTLAANLALVPNGPDFTKAALTREQGYVGPGNGPYRLLPDGTSQHALSVIQISNGQLKILDSGPLSFGPSPAATPAPATPPSAR